MSQISGLSHPVTSLIHFQIGHSNDLRFGCTTGIEPAKYGSHAGYELAKANRLSDIVVGTSLQRPHHVVLRVSHRDHQDPDFGRKSANFPTGFHSTDSRHIDV